MAHLPGHWDGVGDTPLDVAENAANQLYDEIHRPGRKIQTVSDEEWNKICEEARQNILCWERVQQEEKWRKHLEEQREKLRVEQAKEYNDQLARDVARDKKHREWYEAFFNQIHEPDYEKSFSAGTWQSVYRNVSWFIVKVDAAYNWTQLSTPIAHPVHRLRVLQESLKPEDAQYFVSLAIKEDPKTKKQISYSQALKTALGDHVKEIAPTEGMLFDDGVEARKLLLQDIIDSEQIGFLLVEEALRE